MGKSQLGWCTNNHGSPGLQASDIAAPTVSGHGAGSGNNQEPLRGRPWWLFSIFGEDPQFVSIGRGPRQQQRMTNRLQQAAGAGPEKGHAGEIDWERKTGRRKTTAPGIVNEGEKGEPMS